jgi:hypothetical protein
MTRQTIRTIAMNLTALALGLLPAFFVAVSVFADGQWAQRSFLMLAIILGYGFLGFLGGWLSASWSTALWVGFPALPALLVFGEDTLFSLGYFVLIAGGVTLGAAAGVWARLGRQSTRF